MLDKTKHLVVGSVLVGSLAVSVGALAVAALAISKVTPHTCPTAAPPAKPLTIALPEKPAVQWAAKVRSFSTEYTVNSWSAQQALGAPDVFPGSGDNYKAWASLGADDRDEYLEVGFAQPVRASAALVYETFNPGAVQTIEMITVSGKRISIYETEAAPTGTASNRIVAELAQGCTEEAIVAVRVNVNSTAVTGWNEIDAIGLQPCATR